MRGAITDQIEDNFISQRISSLLFRLPLSVPPSLPLSFSLPPSFLS